MSKVQQRLTMWKGRLLARPGRVTLVNFMLSYIPAYTMQTQWLPSGTCEKLDAISQKFIWSGSDSHRMHLVKWDKITQRRKDGGLGVCVARFKNTSLLGKLIWDLLAHPTKLWVQVIFSKYRVDNVTSLLQLSGSYFLRSLRKAYDSLQLGFQLQLGNGHSSLWFTNWFYGTYLAPSVPFVHLQDINIRVCDVWDDGHWALEKLYLWLSDETKAGLQALTLCLHPNAEDVIVWSSSVNGEYTAKASYRWLCDAGVATRGTWH
uniref:Ribonuclease H protein At1g65750 family n=1 Tax=Cajanus cajan TaxID=3821 RepID=A0A151SNR3_CAJCA|nr:Putative ribonuclease H protein At1g65750 family [Cajanus cajan]